MRRSVALLVLGCLTSMAGLGSPAVARAGGADGDSPITADLNGVLVPATKAGQLFCHDFEYPHLHCFSTAAQLETAMAATAYGSADYVTVYSDASYQGTYAHLSQNYDGLWVIGWNDQISSFKVRNSARGAFYLDWYAGGRNLDFCCNSTVPYLSATFDNNISSAYRR